MSRAPGAFVLRTVAREGVPHAYVSSIGRDGGWGVTWNKPRARRLGDRAAAEHAQRINALAAPRFQVEVVPA